MCHVYGLFALTTVLERYRNFDQIDVPVFIAVTILHRIVRVELELEQRQSERCRDGVGPGDVLVESDRDEVS